MAPATSNSKVAALMVAVVLTISKPQPSAADPDPLQDIAVADLASDVLVNGYAVLPASNATIDDFISSALMNPGNTTGRKLKALVTPGFVPQFPGVNTQGVAAARIDFDLGGLNPPHIHPRATELFFLVKGGPLHVGFVSSTTNPDTNNPPNQLFNGTLYEGQVIVFPRGLVHFQKNIGPEPAYCLAAFNGQNPGVETIANVLFNAFPSPISSDILEQAFGLDATTVAQLTAYAQKE